MSARSDTGPDYFGFFLPIAAIALLIWVVAS